MRMILSAMVVWFGLAGLAGADGENDGIVVTGVGQVAAVPDIARIIFGVSHRAVSADDALREVTQDVTRVITLLDAFGIAPEDRQTSGFYLNRRDKGSMPNDSGAASQSYFQSGNMITIKVRDIDALGRLISEVTAEGVNDIRGISFAIEEDEGLLAQARKRAVADAMARAKQLADAANVKLGDLVSMYESGGISRAQGAGMMEMSGRSAPIEQGEVGISAKVTMRFAIAP